MPILGVAGLALGFARVAEALRLDRVRSLLK